jgi:hypothetical protein
MAQPLGGPGLPLPIPTNLYPSELFNAPYDFGQNYETLAAGQSLVIPAGTWFVNVGVVSLLQYLDPITGIWRELPSARNGMTYVKSDGFNVRVANLTGCPVAAIVTGGGSAYVQGTTTVTASAGNSVWQPIVGGQASVVSVTAAGAGYGMAPLLFISPPPAAQAQNAPNPAEASGPLGGIGGVQAFGYCTISAGTVSGVTLTNVGAGYPSAPTAMILPNPFDPNINTGITPASVTLGLTGAGAITAVLCVNPGVAQTSATAPTLTAAGAGTGATISAVMMQCVTGGSVAAGGFAFGTAAVLRTYGGQPTVTPAYTNPAIEQNSYRPRDAEVGLTTTAGSITAVGSIYDPGLFLGIPFPVLSTMGSPSSTAPNVVLAMGFTTDTILIQPAP